MMEAPRVEGCPDGELNVQERIPRRQAIRLIDLNVLTCYTTRVPPYGPRCGKEKLPLLKENE